MGKLFMLIQAGAVDARELTLTYRNLIHVLKARHHYQETDEKISRLKLFLDKAESGDKIWFNDDQIIIVTGKAHTV